MGENELVFVYWPDISFRNGYEIEEGYVLEENEDQIKFQSVDDGSINWVPKKYLNKQ